MKKIEDHSMLVQIGDIFHYHVFLYLITARILYEPNTKKNTCIEYKARAYDHVNFSFIKEGVLGESEILRRSKVEFDSVEEEAKIRLLLL